MEEEKNLVNRNPVQHIVAHVFNGQFIDRRHFKRVRIVFFICVKTLPYADGEKWRVLTGQISNNN